MKDSRYEEALERARQGLPIDEVFPELKESEDERIRKAIESIICVYGKTQGGWIAGYDMDTLVVHLRDAFACLEKQKEQKPTAEEVLIMAGLKPFRDGNQWCILAGGNIQEGICGFGDTIDEALYQFLMEVLEIQKSKQPAEWSEEDIDKMVETRARKSGATKSEMAFYRAGIEDTLKSLRPQPHWKPSEYTLSLVKKVANGEMLTHMEQMAMETLYDDLQKLL